MISVATHSVRSSQCPVATAFGITVSAVDPLAFTSQAKPTQKGHCTHAERPSYVTELIAIGIGNGCNPSPFAAACNFFASLLKGSGGIG